MIEQFIQRTVNKLIDNDPPSRDRVIEMAGMRFKIVLTDIKDQPSRIIEAMNSGYISIIEDVNAEVDCCIKGKTSTYLNIVKSTNETLSMKGMIIEGDADTAIKFAKFAQNLDLDFEALLEPRIGRFASRQLFYIGGRLSNIRRDFSARSKRVIGEAIVDELRLSPSKIELEIEGERLEDLNQRLDALEAAAQK